MSQSSMYSQITAVFNLKSTRPLPSDTSTNTISSKSYKIQVQLKRNQKQEQAAKTPKLLSHSILDHMMKSGYQYMGASSCRFNEINGYVVQQFVNKVRLELEDNQIYDNLIQSEYILDILDEHQRCYINHQQFSQLIEIILDYMAISKNYSNKNEKKLPTNLKLTNLASSIASRWLKLKNQIYFNNKDSLKMLEYIIPKQQRTAEYDHSFFDLLFDFSEEEVRKVARAVKSLCKYDIRAFCYLTNYLYLSCINLEKKMVKISQIDSKLKEILKMLDEENLPAQPFDGENSLVQIHKDFKAKIQDYPRKYIDLKDIQGSHKMDALENYIERRIGQATHVVFAFNDLVKNICMKYGYHYLSSLKLKDKTEKMALDRVIEKILVDYSKKSPQKTLEVKPSYPSIDQLTDAEYKQYQRNMRTLMENINEPIQFKVSDLLRSKCMFANVHKLNRCLSELKQQIEIRGYKIVELKNRLKKKTSDILIKLLIEETIAEIQMALDFKVAENEFNHKIYELRRSQLFSPITMLRQLNQKMSNNYFKEMKAIISCNVRFSSTHEYLEEISYEDVEAHFDHLIGILPLNIDFKKPHRNQIDINLMGKQIKRFAEIKDKPVDRNPILIKLEKLKRNGEYMFEMKEYFQAQKWLQKYCEMFKSEYPQLFDKVGSHSVNYTATWHGFQNSQESTSKLALEKHEKYLIRNYAQALHLISKINTDIGNYDKSIDTCGLCKALLLKIETDVNDGFLGELEKNIGWNSFKKGNYIEAIRNYENYLFAIQDKKGTYNMDYALILNNIGLVHDKSGNYNQSLRYFEQSLSIQESIKGKYSIQYAATLENIGLVYLNQGYYSKSIQIFQKCLEVEEKAMGKDSVNCAQTLNNIGNVYSKMGKSQEALLYYKRCLLIEQKVKGKQYIDYAMILNNIGLIYFNEYNYQQALKYYQKCLRIKERVLGKSCIDLVSTLTNIGLTYANRGQYDEALHQYKRCLTIQENANNKDNIDYSNTLNNIAIVEKQLGNYMKSIQLLEKAMNIVQSIEGSQSIDFAFFTTSLAEVYNDQENYDYALVHYEIALEIMTKIFERQSFDCANVINCIAQIHCKMGNLEDALRLTEESLHIKQKIRGKDEIDCVSCLNNLGEIYMKIGQFEQSERYYLQSLSICEKRNVKFIDYGKTCLGLGNLYEKQDRLEQSKNFKEVGLQILSKLKPKIYERFRQ